MREIAGNQMARRVASQDSSLFADAALTPEIRTRFSRIRT